MGSGKAMPARLDEFRLSLCETSPDLTVNFSFEMSILQIINYTNGAGCATCAMDVMIPPLLI